MDTWQLAIAVIGLVIVALGAVAGAAVVHGTQREKIRSLEDRMGDHAKEIEEAKTRLAKGDTQFAIISQSMKGMESSLARIETLLSVTIKRPKPSAEADDN